MTRIGRGRTLALAVVLSATHAVAQPQPVNAVPPAVAPSLPHLAFTTSLLLGRNPDAHEVRLLAPSAAELESKRAKASAKRVQIGFGREVPAVDQVIALRDLSWRSTADGGASAQVRVTSQGAAAMRVAIRSATAPPGLVVRVTGSEEAVWVGGPYTMTEIAAASAAHGEWWTPVADGPTTIIEFTRERRAPLGDHVVTLVRVSHLERALASMGGPLPANATGPGTSGSCNINWTCEPKSAALTHAANAVAMIYFAIEDGRTFACTATLLNDAKSSLTPYLFTAHHCIDSAYAARNLNSFWFYEAAGCKRPPDTGIPGVRQNSGGVVLASSVAEDWALLKLAQPPPAGATYSAWNAALPTGGDMIILHHPSADLKKISHGTVRGLSRVVAPNEHNGQPEVNADLIQVSWARGVTEGGSSGGGLLTLAAAGYYEVRGGLEGGASACHSTHGADHFSRLDRMLALTREYLAPGTDPADQVIVVEFYNKALDHFFMSSNAAEIADLDSGKRAGWERTGLRFRAYDKAVAGAQPVCRFYRSPGFGDSHFYSASASECEAVRNDPVKFPGWTFESASVFYVVVPDQAGACPAGYRPLWRFFRAGVTNHRYTADVSVRDLLRSRSAEWTPEGTGLDAVIMCSQDG